jgi:GT2 family glycosyltransferase
VVRRSLLDAEVLATVAAARSAWRLALLLAVTADRRRRVIHVPEVLAALAVPVPDVPRGPDPADSRRVVTGALAARGVTATVDAGTGPTRLLRRSVRGKPLVSVVIPTAAASGAVRGRPRVYLLRILEDLAERTSYDNLQVVVVADTSVGDDVLDAAARIVGDRLVVLRWDRPFSFSGKVDLGVAAASGEMALLLNDDVEVLDAGWLEPMVALAQEPDVGLVGATLLFEDDTLQHAGHLYRGPRRIGHVGLGADSAEAAADPSLLAERECSGVTAACALVRRDRFLAVGGFSPSLPVTFNDVDFCLKIRQRGWRIVCTPAARLHHFETRTRRPGVGPSEQALVVRRWGRLLERDDPYWPAADHRAPEPPWSGLARPRPAPPRPAQVTVPQ